MTIPFSTWRFYCIWNSRWTRRSLLWTWPDRISRFNANRRRRRLEHRSLLALHYSNPFCFNSNLARRRPRFAKATNIRATRHPLRPYRRKFPRFCSEIRKFPKISRFIVIFFSFLQKFLFCCSILATIRNQAQQSLQDWSTWLLRSRRSTMTANCGFLRENCQLYQSLNGRNRIKYSTPSYFDHFCV